MAAGKFLADTVDTLARRAALICSNPDCGILTAGPAANDIDSVNLGEAAHIFGRTETSARFNRDLSPAELADITNGIWLCRNCHKAADNDPQRFPAALLFQWRRTHEQAMLARLGKQGDQLREKVQSEHLRSFSSVSYLAQQIILDRPSLWEYKLTLELLRTELGAIWTRWDHLRRGLYVRKASMIQDDQILNWFSSKFDDLQRSTRAVLPLLEELSKSWGEPGVPGDDKQIVCASRLIVRVAENLLEWEEDIRFAHVPTEFRQALLILHGVGGQQLDEVFRIPHELGKVLAEDNPTGTRRVDLVFSMPPNFVEDFGAAMERAVEEFFGGLRRHGVPP